MTERRQTETVVLGMKASKGCAQEGRCDTSVNILARADTDGGVGWRKQGHIFSVDGRYAWMTSHAQLPIVERISHELLRIYFGTRDHRNRTVTTYCEVAADDPQKVLYVHDRPILDLGERGCFDDSGAMPSWIVNHGGLKYLFYTGWNVSTTVSYRKAIGIAVSHDGGHTFARLFRGPILDRIATEPYCAATPCVLVDGTLWRMWYLSCVRWEAHEDRLDPYYHIKYAESEDGIHWERRGRIALDLQSSDEGGFGRPCVRRQPGQCYAMWYSYRAGKHFRSNRKASYRIGYAESNDGISWTRMDERAGIGLSEIGWDADMIAYPYVVDAGHSRQFMFYNGNGFGRSGFGYAERPSPASHPSY